MSMNIIVIHKSLEESLQNSVQHFSVDSWSLAPSIAGRKLSQPIEWEHCEETGEDTLGSWGLMTLFKQIASVHMKI